MIDPSPTVDERIAFPPPILVKGVALLLLLVAGWWGYRIWQRRTTETLQQACLAALEAEDWELAEQLGLRWRDHDPDNTRILAHLAEAARRQQALDRTADYLLQIPDSDPDALTLLALAAEVQFAGLNAPLAAEQTWLRMIAIEPRSNAPRRKLMYFYALSLQRQKLGAQVRDAIRHRAEPPDAYVYLLLRQELRFSDSFPIVSGWLRTHSTDETLKVAQACALADAPKDIDLRYYGDGEFKPGSLKLIEQCRELYPHNIEIIAFDLERAIDLGDLSSVETLLQSPSEAIQQDPRFWRSQGWYLRGTNELAEAEVAYQTALKLDPFDWRARHELAQLLRRTGRAEEAEKLAVVALEGKDLERSLLERPNTSDLPTDLLRRIGRLARDVGAAEIAEAVQFRVGNDEQMQPESTQAAN
ncbi:MAG: tetratricopeptide repeat protein [Planctomycetaceae bacterium]